MTQPVAARGVWATLEDLPVAVAELHSATEWFQILATATDVLWASSGRRWRGEQPPVTVALRAAPPRPGEAGWPYHRSWGQCSCYGGVGYSGGGALIPTWVTSDRDRGGHHDPAAIRLPHPDVTAVTSVTVDGLPFVTWRLDGAWLSRTDGNGWPMCGDRASATYSYGRTPPAGGVAACVALASELGRALSSDPDQPCALPQRVQQITRQGITFSDVDDLAFLDKGLTGLLPVDLWLRSVNPYGRAQAGQVWSPDIPRATRR